MKICPGCSCRYVGKDWRCPSCSFTPPIIEGFPALSPELANSGNGFKPDAFSKLAALEANNFWFRARNKLITWSMRYHFPDMERYLEIGCGTGYVLSAIERSFPRAVVTGSEIFSTGLPFAAQRVERAMLFQMDARNIPYDNEFDVIGAFDVLEHISEDKTVLSKISRALLPEGGLILTVPQHPWMWSVQDEYACHVRRYRVGELREKVLEAGFDVLLETSFVSLLLPVMFSSRFLRQLKTHKSDPTDELRLNLFLNRILESIMSLERQLIRLGLHFPIGGSLLLVAKKRGTS